MNVRRLKVVMPLLVVGFCFVILASGDWWMRFDRFRWHDRLIKNRILRAATSGPNMPGIIWTNLAVAGGDLSRLISVREIASRYEETKPETIVFTDEGGYANRPPTDHAKFPVIVVGDSFMQVQFGEAGSFAQQLSSSMDQTVYNHAYPGRGVFWPLFRFIADGRFDDRMPAVIVWGILEREIGGGVFASFPNRLKNAKAMEGEEQTGSAKVDWHELSANALRKSLPDTSFFAAVSRWIWKLASYSALGLVTTDVVESLPDEQGMRYLFYRYSLEPLSWSPEARNAPLAAEAVSEIRSYLAAKGSDLLVVLIPEKEQVYRELIPVTPAYRPDTWPGSVLMSLEEELRYRSVPVVNLLPAFIAAKENGVSLYWRDDTHWRPEAMKIAAGLTAEVAQKILDRAK